MDRPKILFRGHVHPWPVDHDQTFVRRTCPSVRPLTWRTTYLFCLRSRSSLTHLDPDLLCATESGRSASFSPKKKEHVDYAAARTMCQELSHCAEAETKSTSSDAERWVGHWCGVSDKVSTPSGSGCDKPHKLAPACTERARFPGRTREEFIVDFPLGNPPTCLDALSLRSNLAEFLPQRVLFVLFKPVHLVQTLPAKELCKAGSQEGRVHPSHVRMLPMLPNGVNVTYVHVCYRTL